MPSTRRVALMLDLEWPYKRHADLFAGTQQYASDHGWESIIDEFVYDTLPVRGTQRASYDGVIARATKTLAERAARLNIPVVNVWLSSPALNKLPGVFPDYAAFSSGRRTRVHRTRRLRGRRLAASRPVYAGVGTDRDRRLDGRRDLEQPAAAGAETS
jgi:hypothetical protein